MSAFQRDLYLRVLYTALASGAGTVIAYFGDLTYWWAIGLAAGGTVVRGLLTSLGQSGGMPTVSLLERTAWTAVEAFIAAIPVANVGLPAVFLPLFTVALATLKGWIAKHVGDPTNAAMLPAGTRA